MLILCLFKFMNMNNLQSGLFFSLTGITAVASLSSCASQKKTEEQKPYNIVYIMTDDHTAQMMSCYDKRYMETPNLDRIANDGVRFTNSFVANSLSDQNFIEIMKANGFYEIKMEYTTLNHTVWEDLKNRIIDLHCFEYTDEGEILYDGDCFPVETFSGKGRIEEIEVSCIEPYSQVMFHLGYEFDENDAHDVKLLCETLHIEIPNEYR